jgi:hypothetical protein
MLSIKFELYKDMIRIPYLLYHATPRSFYCQDYEEPFVHPEPWDARIKLIGTQFRVGNEDNFKPGGFSPEPVRSFMHPEAVAVFYRVLNMRYP